jgi:hypothetical protein
VNLSRFASRALAVLAGVALAAAFAVVSPVSPDIGYLVGAGLSALQSPEAVSGMVLASAMPAGVIRAKFTIQKLERQLSNVPDPDNPGKWKTGEVVSIHASPVCGNGDPNHENTKFWQATPTGSLMLGTVNAAAAAHFQLGASYYVDFSPAS